MQQIPAVSFRDGNGTEPKKNERTELEPTFRNVPNSEVILFTVTAAWF